LAAADKSLLTRLLLLLASLLTKIPKILELARDLSHLVQSKQKQQRGDRHPASFLASLVPRAEQLAIRKEDDEPEKKLPFSSTASLFFPNIE